MFPEWHHAVPESAYFKVPETLKTFRMYSISRYASCATRLYVRFAIITSVIPRHIEGAVPLRVVVKTAITATPPVVFHSFPLPVTHVIFFAVLPRNQGGIPAEPRRCHCGHGDPIELPPRFDGGATAIIGGMTAVLAVALRSQ